MALVACVVAVSGGRAAVAGAARGPYQETLARAGGRLAAQAGGPQAVAALAEMAGLDENVAPAALEAAVRRGLPPGADPLVAAQVAFLLAHLLDERGATEEASALREGLGFLTHTFVIGPFGEGRPSFKTPFPPEGERDIPELGRVYPGKIREVGWRRADAAVRDGALLLDGLLRPDDQAVAYVAAFVHSDADRQAALRLGSPGPLKVWVNGAPVFERDVTRAATLDQDAAGVRLGRGWNRILIKTVVVDGAWRLYARLTDPKGAPLRFANAPGPPPAKGTWVVARKGSRSASPVGVWTLDAQLQAG